MIWFFFFLFFEDTFANKLLIHDARELTSFSSDVNNGTNYSGASIYFDADINFDEKSSQEFAPIGYNSEHCFLGTFDGQGHTIRNLVLNSSLSSHIGLFGYSGG